MGNGQMMPFVIVVLFDRRSGRPADADAVATHDGEAFLALTIQEGGLHGLRCIWCRA